MSNRLKRLARRLHALRHRDGLDREVSEEMRAHIEMETEDLARTRGLSPDEARRQALVGFGGVERFREAHRDARGVRWLEDLVQDVRYAARALRRSPAFTLSAGLVLALGIGSSTAIFSAVDAVLVRHLPYPDDERLVRIYQQHSPTNVFGVSAADFNGIESQQRSFSSVGAVTRRDVGISAGRDPRRATVGVATAGFFRTLGVRAARGRTIEPTDQAPGAPAVAVVGHDFVVHEWGGDDAAALGRTVTIDGVAHTVVGVLAAGVRDLAGVRAEIWPALQLQTPTRRGPFFLRVVARLKTGLTIEAAQRDLAGVSERLFQQWAASFQDHEAKLTPHPLRSAMLGDAGKTLGLFAAAVTLVLLIAVANVASLMLVRVTARSREAALRAVLGASRGRLGRLLVTESVLLAASGALAGMLLAWALLRVLVTMGPAMPRLAEATLDVRAFGFAAVIALLTGVLIGVYPVVSVFGRDLAPTLRSGDRQIGSGRRTHLLRGALVTAQLGLALPLLAGAGLLLNSFVRLQRVDAGFDPRPLLYVHVSLPSARYADPATVTTFWTRAVARVRELPGVLDAGLNQSMPPDEPADINNFDLVDRPVTPGSAQPVSPWNAVTSEFFRASGVPLLEGRLFTEADSANAPPVLLVSRGWVRQFSSDRSPIGRQLIGGGCTSCTPYTIVGVVGDVKYLGLGGTSQGVYEPFAQNTSSDVNLFVRTAGPPVQWLDRVRETLRSVDAGLPLDDAGAMDDRVSESVAPQRHWTTLLGGFAIAALVLAAVGIFGMLSYLVTSRQREIGVRVALGAKRGEVMAMIVRRGMSLAAVGAAIGLTVSFLARGWLEGSLYDVTAADPATLVGVTGLLLAVAFLASWLPARRAAAVAPMDAIRGD